MTTTIIQSIPFPHRLGIISLNEDKENWKHFKTVFENYEIASQLKKQPMEVRLATYLSCFSKEAYQIYDNIEYDDVDDKKDITQVILKLDAHFKGQVNETFERNVFFNRKQQEGESFDSFATALKELSNTCNFENQRDKLIRVMLCDKN